MKSHRLCISSWFPAFPIPSRPPPNLHFPDNFRAAFRHRVAMKILSRLFFLTASLVVAFAADPLTEAFQRGMLAEESQRDLRAAAMAYGEVIRQSDAQRALIATALFRLAETQRRLGQTNEALAGYRRLVREFAERTNLTASAREWLPEKPEGGAGVAVLARRLVGLRAELEDSSREHAELTAYLERTKRLSSPHEIARAVDLRQPTPVLTSLRGDRNVAELSLTRLRSEVAADHPDVIRCKAILATIDEQLEREVKGILGAHSARASSLERQIENQRATVRVLEAKLAQETQDGSLPGQVGGRQVEELSKLQSRLAALESEREDAVAAFNRLTQVDKVVAEVKPGQVAAQLRHAPELEELARDGSTLTEQRDAIEAEAAQLEERRGKNDAKVRELRALAAKQDEVLEALRKRSMAAFQAQLQSLGAAGKTMDREIEELRGNVRRAETDALLSGWHENPVDAQRRLLAEEIQVAEEQVAVRRKLVEAGEPGSGQNDLLQAQRDVLALKRQLAALTRRDLLDVTLEPTAAPSVPEQRPRWISVGGEVKLPGNLKLPDDRSMDLFEAINAQGGLTSRADPRRIKVARGTNVFRFKLDELMTNRFELQHEDKVQVVETVF